MTDQRGTKMPERFGAVGPGTLQRILAWALQILLTMFIGVLAWNVQQLSATIKTNGHGVRENDRRLSVLEANRFGVDDGLKMQAEIARVWKELSNYPKRSEVPPPLFLKQVEDIARRVERMETRMLSGDRKE